MHVSAAHRDALYSPAVRSLAISVGRSQAGDDAPTDVETAFSPSG
jgi:hypothetical protein